MSGLVEGRNPVLEALRGERVPQEVFLAQGVREAPVINEIVSLARERGITVKRVDRRDLDVLSERGAHQGVIARFSGFVYATLDEVLTKSVGRSQSLILVLDHVEDPGNLGAIVRSAEAFGADGVVIPEKRAASMTAVALKAAAGAAEHIPVVMVTNIARTIERLKEVDYWVAGAAEDAESPSWDSALEGRLVLVMGSEGVGLSRLVRERCDFLVAVPLPGETSSLNVAQAATVLAYDWMRRGEK